MPGMTRKYNSLEFKLEFRNLMTTPMGPHTCVGLPLTVGQSVVATVQYSPGGGFF